MQQEKEFLSGIIERITYHNEENGFYVLRVKVKSCRDLTTVIGKTPTAAVGEYIKCSGIWHNDRNHGKQFKADFLKSLPPNSLEGIEKYLGSGLIKGIGPHFAKKLVGAFGEEVFDIIESKPRLLSTIGGIGKMRADSICRNWQDQKIVREIMVFLQSHGIGTARATRIFKTYGNDAIETVSNNPYCLARDIRGIGFASADNIANNLGIDRNSLIRAKAGISHILLEATSDGHCGLPQEMLIEQSSKLLEIESELLIEAMNQEINDNILVADELGDLSMIFLLGFYIQEKKIAEKLLLLKKGELPWSQDKLQQRLKSAEKKLSITLASNQRNAILTALQNKVMVITGGPGTGKTTIMQVLLNILSNDNLKIKLCAPTGRAAKRLSEATKLDAVTIHRLLEIDSAYGGFKHNENNLLDCNYLIIDEASMVDTKLCYALLKASPDKTALLIIGDIDQLPSVGAGQILKDIISSEIITTIKLTEIFRQSSQSQITTNAHRINKGLMPILNNQDETDFYFIEAEEGDDIINKAILIVKERAPKKFKLHPVNDIQLLCPMQRGGVGARSMNIELQRTLNPNCNSGISKYGQIFAVGDKVMQTENDYDKEIYNGDIGRIISIDQINQELYIKFDDREVLYGYTDLDQITLAYATTIHKSQGSEYPAVIIPLNMQSYMMLQRNLIYTAITRAKRLVIIIGQKKALAIAVKNNQSSARYTKLQEWLQMA